MAEEHTKKEEHKEHVEHHEEKKTSSSNSLKKNPWIIATFVFGIIAIILLVPFLGLSGGNVSATKAGDNLISYLNTIADSNVTLKNISESNGLYLITVTYKSQDIPLYVTKDGKMYTSALLPLIKESTTPTDQPPAEIPKTDKPSVELYVFTYCPYGLQMEKAAIPAAKLFGSKIDFKIRQIGAMHGDFEKVEAERQLCVEKNYPTKYLDYVTNFATTSSIGSCNGDATCLDPLLTVIYSKLGIDKSKINACMTTDGITMYAAEEQNANSKGVSGSPTVIINGVETSLSRSSEDVKAAICSAFKNAPTECSQTLSTTPAAAGFGGGAGSSATTGAQC
ncbi:Uncharacterised protein [uncultured archaeon]|nr:Uncharacterised protein [uncultured archaeon]